MSHHLLEINNLSVIVNVEGEERRLLDDVSLVIPRESIVGLVGGSGSGKTTTGLSILRLLPLGLRISKGRILFNGQDLLKKTDEEMPSVRGKEIGMVFQEPLNAFNPVFSIGSQIDEVLKVHTSLAAKQRKVKIFELLEIVGLDDPGRVIANYPHQLSGGMRQRAMIAQTIAAGPKLIIADEPTSSLDVTLQAKIMELFRELRQKLNLSILLITHDLGMIEHLSDQIYVMQKGKVVESGKTKEVLVDPQHIYTQELLEAG